MKSKLFSVIIVAIFIFSATTPLLNALEHIKAPLKSIGDNETVNNTIDLNSTPNNNTTNQTGMTIYVDSAKGNDSWAGGDPSYPKRTIKGALRAAPDYATISLNPGCVFKENGIYIGKDVTIDGHGAVIDGGNDGRVMETGYTKRITIRGVTIKNGKVRYHPKDGAGLYIHDHSKVTIENCNFQNNRAENPSMGGAIYNVGIYLKIINSNFTSNKAYRGGAISNIIGKYSRDINKIEIENCTFTKNEAHEDWLGGGEGGAIYNGRGVLNILSSTFKNNYAANGGAVYSYNGNLNLENTKFERNAAKNNEYGEGGAVYQYSDTLNIKSCSFDWNYANGNGGVIKTKYTNLNIDKSKFLWNGYSDDITRFTKNGGALFIEGTDKWIHITESIFEGNIAHNGGGVYAQWVKLNVENSAFTKHFVQNRGGAFYLEGAEILSYETLIFAENYNRRGAGDNVFTK